MLDRLLLAGELGARQVFWRSPFLNDLYHRRRNRGRETVVVDRTAVSEHLERIGVSAGALVMLHSSLGSLAFRGGENGAPPVSNPLAIASQLLSDLVSLVGDRGTLVMPTHPNYKGDPGFMHDKSGLVFPYDPVRTPSRVGLVTDLFRRRRDAQRSLHPLSSVASRGPLTDELLRGNLNEDRPLPHGVHSAYYAFCRLGGLVVSLGTSLIKSMTVLHVAEEVRDRDWPVQGFFYERRFRIGAGEAAREWLVRERRPEFVRSLGLGKVRRDLLRAGILHETEVAGLRVDWARADQVLEFISRRNQGSTYPYFLPGLSRL